MSDRTEIDGASPESTGLLDRELARLRDEVADRAQLADFALVEARAVRRRRSRIAAVGSVLAAAAVVAAIVLAPGLDAVQEPTPAPGTDTPSRVEKGAVPQAVQHLVKDDRAHRFVVAGGLDGSVAVIWRNLVQPAPTFALVTRTADGVVTGQLLDEPFNLTAVPGGWVGTLTARAIFVQPDGAVTDLPISADKVTPERDDWLVDTAGGPLVLGPPPLRELSRANVQGEAAFLTEEGHLVTYEADALRIQSPTGGGTSVPAETSGVVFVGRGLVVAAVALGDSADGSIPVVGLSVSQDGGRLWQDLDLSDVEIGGVTSAAVLLDDSIVLATPEQGLFRVAGSRVGHEGAAPALILVAGTGEAQTYGWDANGRAYVLDGADVGDWQLLPDAGYI